MVKFSNFAGSSMRNRRRYGTEDDDPTSGLTNLSDCMLVLACGLMVALVVAWNIDITQYTEVEQTDNKQEISDLESITDDFKAGGTNYIDMGRVYQDPETGKLYMVEESTTTESGD